MDSNTGVNIVDTLTIDYAINKLTQGYQAIAPNVHDISEKYVQFVVTQEVVGAVVFGAAWLILLGLLVFVSLREFEDVEKGFLVLIFSVLILFATGFFLAQTYSAILAYNNPEMFTIDKVLSGNK